MKFLGKKNGSDWWEVVLTTQHPTPFYVRASEGGHEYDLEVMRLGPAEPGKTWYQGPAKRLTNG